MNDTDPAAMTPEQRAARLVDESEKERAALLATPLAEWSNEDLWDEFVNRFEQIDQFLADGHEEGSRGLILECGQQMGMLATEMNTREWRESQETSTD
jgi:hypothetical protein